jgi:hypothetical protein
MKGSQHINVGYIIGASGYRVNFIDNRTKRRMYLLDYGVNVLMSVIF